MTQATIGEISSGTLRAEDLLRALGLKLKELDTEHQYAKLIHEAGVVDPDSDEAPFVVDELGDALQEFCPDYVYFGSLEGDGACFGFWPDVSGAQEDQDITKCDDLSMAPNVPYCLVINDHGNATLYRGTVEWEELWAVV